MAEEDIPCEVGSETAVAPALLSAVENEPRLSTSMEYVPAATVLPRVAETIEGLETDDVSDWEVSAV